MARGPVSHCLPTPLCLTYIVLNVSRWTFLFPFGPKDLLQNAFPCLWGQVALACDSWMPLLWLPGRACTLPAAPVVYCDCGGDFIGYRASVAYEPRTTPMLMSEVAPPPYRMPVRKNYPSTMSSPRLSYKDDVACVSPVVDH